MPPKDIAQVLQAFSNDGGETIATVDVARVCAEAGHPLSHEELDDAVAALDPSRSGAVPAEEFFTWWSTHVGGGGQGSPGSPGSGFSEHADSGSPSRPSPNRRLRRKSGSNSARRSSSASASRPGTQEGGGLGLSDVRQLRKQAQNDAQLLQNRIALLQQEEEKARKKIRQTQARAQEMLELRKRHLQKVHVRQAIEEEQAQIRAENQQRVQQIREQHAVEAERAAIRAAEAKAVEADQVRQVRRKHQVELERLQKEQVEQARRKRDVVKSKEGHAQYIQAARTAAVKQSVRAELEAKLAEELALTSEKERIVRALEQEELELIERLKKVQAIQEQAFRELEDALGGDALPSVFAEHAQDSFRGASSGRPKSGASSRSRTPGQKHRLPKRTVSAGPEV